MAARVIIPLPSRDFDPSEAAVSWAVLRSAGLQVAFATPDGAPASGDPLMLTGEGLDLWGAVPGLRRLKVLGLVLRANAEARGAYGRMVQDPAFVRPLPYGALDPLAFEGLLLPGGHRAAGMRPYLESLPLQRFVASCFEADKPVGAICHGVLLAARSPGATGRSVLHGRRTTALTWRLERAAWTLMKVAGRVWDPNYYRTYLEGPGEAAGHASVEAEVTRALAAPGDFLDVAPGTPGAFRKGSGLFRDTEADPGPAFVVRDGKYVSARWPGDVHLFAHTFADLLR